MYAHILAIILHLFSCSWVILLYNLDMSLEIIDELETIFCPYLNGFLDFIQSQSGIENKNT